MILRSSKHIYLLKSTQPQHRVVKEYQKSCFPSLHKQQLPSDVSGSQNGFGNISSHDPARVDVNRITIRVQSFQYHR